MEEDAQLLFAYARRGDVQSLAALVRRHATWMQALLRGMLPVAADVDDVFQETWMRVVRAASSYRGGRVRPYLATVARSAAIDHMRRTRAMVSLDDEEGDGAAAAESIADDGPGPDEAFASGVLGEGVGITPEEEEIYAPFDGTVTTLAESKHAIGLTGPGGMELLIHVGVDTVMMNGDGFEPRVKEGDKVTCGQPLMHFDRKKIKAAGHPDVVVVLMTNSDDLTNFRIML